MTDASAHFLAVQPQMLRLAYHMLGTLSEAEDVVQDVYLRWRSVAHAQVSDPTGYLLRMVSHLCIDTYRSARIQRTEYIGPWLPAPLIEPLADPAQLAERTNDLSLATLLLLERLNPVERAVFVLREALDYSYAEIASILDKSPAACRQIARRARQHLAAATDHASDPQTHMQLFQALIMAVREGDLEQLLEILHSDAVLYADGGGLVSTARRPVQGALSVARFLVGLFGKAPANARAELVAINHQPGLLFWVGDELITAMALDTDASSVRQVFMLRSPRKLPAAAAWVARTTS